MENRKKLSKKIRFEVLKRDKFTCQYCGAQAPDVVLEVDHITPVSKGGTNDVTNLITSCRGCNSGKSNRELSDDAVVKKQKAQLDELQIRREQLEMMHEWQMQLTKDVLTGADIVSDVISSISGIELADSNKRTISKLIKQFGLSEVCDAARSAFIQYDDFGKAFDKIGGICWCNAHVTCYDCVNYKGRTRVGSVRCDVFTNPGRSVKVAETCDEFEEK